MAAKRISVWSVAAVVVGGVLLLSGYQSWAAPAPPAKGQPLPVPGSSPAILPDAVDGQLAPSPVPAGEALVEDDDGAELFGLPVCAPPGRFWLRADYLMWWTNGTRLPPLVTTGPLGPPSTTVLYGSRTIANDGRSGYRTTIGMWLDYCRVWNVEFDYLSLGERANGFTQTSVGYPVLARPYFDVSTNQQSVFLVASPGVAEGTLSVDAKDYFQSAGVLLSYNLSSGDSSYDSGDPANGPYAGQDGLPLLWCCRTDLLVGYRHYNLSDRVVIHEDFDQLVLGLSYDYRDDFSARNDFHGSEIGLRTQLHRGRWSLEILTKIALGNTHHTTTIAGQSAVRTPGQGTDLYDYGRFAAYRNTGTYNCDVFTVVPQLGVELGYQVSYHLRAYLGYNILYWGSVFRAADQIDLMIDPRNIPAGGNFDPDSALPLPAFPQQAGSLWAQGLNLGLEFRF